jgi:hypothetical protein
MKTNSATLLPAFITGKTARVKLKTARKRAAKAAERFTGDRHQGDAPASADSPLHSSA